ncbi:MAG: hypothetical protein HYX69_21975 [Planctomycetia bacterium]|nr:hypothetical protein [Planctomycetia bacterium]
MTVEGLEEFSCDDLIRELINRDTFAGVVVWLEGDIKVGRISGTGQTKMTKSAPLTRHGVETLLKSGLGMLPSMPFDE